MDPGRLGGDRLYGKEVDGIHHRQQSGKAGIFDPIAQENLLKKPARKGSPSIPMRRHGEKKIENHPKDHKVAETDVTTLLHQLQAYQVKLEMVNRRLAISEERARQAVEASNAAMWDYDLTTGEVYLSEMWSSFLGGKKRPTYTTIQALTELVPEEERQRVREAIIRAIRVNGSSEYRLNHRVRRPDGRLIWVHSRGRAVERGPDGRTRRMIGVNFDITDRLQAEMRLTESEQKFRALFESAGDYALVLELQPSGPPIIVDGNRAFFRKHGYTRKELIGQPISIVETAASAGHIAERIRMLSKEVMVRFEVEHLRKDGSTFVVEAVAKMVRGGTDLVYSVERDNTQRRRAEQEQQRLLAENRRLLLQLIRVQEEERRSLARDLHDELGQLLTGIDARAEYIVKHADNDELRAAAREIIRDTKASFAASHSTLNRLRPATLDTLGLTAALTELTSSAGKKMGMDCALHIEGNIDRLDDLHAITIYRLVQEALSNAHRHGHADHAEISVKYFPSRRRRSGRVRVEIHDNGRIHTGRDISEGMGIIGMRERVHALSGTFMLEPILHDGMHIEVVLPLSDEGNN